MENCYPRTHLDIGKLSRVGFSVFDVLVFHPIIDEIHSQSVKNTRDDAHGDAGLCVDVMIEAIARKKGKKEGKQKAARERERERERERDGGGVQHNDQTNARLRWWPSEKEKRPQYFIGCVSSLSLTRLPLGGDIAHQAFKDLENVQAQQRMVQRGKRTTQDVLQASQPASQTGHTTTIRDASACASRTSHAVRPTLLRSLPELGTWPLPSGVRASSWTAFGSDAAA